MIPPVVTVEVATAQGNARKWDGLFVRFTVEKSRKTTPNKAEIELANLSLDSVRFIEAASFVRLSVDAVQLYAGDIRRKGLSTTQDGTTRWTKIPGGDGRAALTSATVALSFPRGESTGSAVRAAIAALGLPVRGALPEGAAFGSPWAFSGRASAVLDELVPGWSVQDGSIDLGAGDTAGRLVRVLREGTGLVGVPERTDKGVKARCTLDPALSPHDYVELASRFVAGYYRVRSVVHRGDSRASEWTTELDLTAV